MRILLAENRPKPAARLSMLLELAGHDVLRVTSGHEALERFQETPFPVVITDLDFNGMDGFELCSRLRNRPAAEYVYIILLVKAGIEFCFEEAERVQADDVLPLPVSPDVLRARLRVAERILNLTRELDQLRGLIPICAYCKKIRTEPGLWQQIESYVCEHSHAQFSHSICPECAEREFGDVMRARRALATGSGTNPPPG